MLTLLSNNSSNKHVSLKELLSLDTRSSRLSNIRKIRDEISLKILTTLSIGLRLISAKLLLKILTILDKNSSTVPIPCNLKKYTGLLRDKRWRATSIAVDVLPNPGDPQMFNSRID
jgi:hypothetical protein